MVSLLSLDPHWLSRRILNASALGLPLSLCSPAAANPFGTPPVSEQSLSRMRGGFELPNGMNVAVGVQIDTYVDHSLALRTVLTVTDKTSSALEITVPPATKLAVADPVVSPAAPVAQAAQVQPLLVTVQTGSSPAAPAPAIGADATLPQDVQIRSDLGTLSIAQTENGSAVILKGQDLEIQHITGNSTGVLIANTMDNRVIDTVATVNISLSDSAVPVGNILLRIESVILDAVGRDMY